MTPQEQESPVVPPVPRRVLVIDDDHDCADGLRELLTAHAYEVAVAGNITTACRQCQEFSPEVALVDLRLGPVRGTEVIAELRRLKPTLRCIVLTAYAELSSAIEALQHGVHDYLQKPADPTALLKAVERAFAQLEAERQHAAALEALRENRERLALALSASRIGTWCWDVRTDRVEWDAATHRIYGRTPGQFAGTLAAVRPCIHPDDRTRVERLAQESLHGGLFDLEHGIVWPDGTVRYVLSRGQVLCDPSGRPERMIGIVLDRTEQKRVEEELRRAQQAWRNIFQAIGHPTLVLDAAHGVVEANPAVERVTGMSAAKLRGRKCHEVFHGTAEPPLTCPFEQLRRSGCAETVEMEMEALGGTFLVSCTPLLDEEGHLDRVIHIATDITQRKRAEQALRESERTLATLMDNLPGMAYRCRNDPQWTMQFVSQGCRTLTGYEPGDLVGNRAVAYADLIHPEDRAAVYAGVQAGVAARRPFQLTYRLVRADGVERWVWEQGRGVFGPDGTLQALEGLMLDITEQKQAEAQRTALERQLQRAQKMEAVGRLAGGIAHDFNNILLAILGNVELLRTDLRGGLVDEGRLQSELDIIDRAGQRARALTRQLLSFSRQQTLRPEVLDPNALLTDMEAMLRRALGEDVHLTLQLEPGLRCVRMDASQFEQVVLNLAVNARDAMPDGGRLTLQTANVEIGPRDAVDSAAVAPGRYVQLTVADTGCGMDAATLAQAFDPFFTTKPPGKGTGLGLATVQSVVQQTGGSVHVESRVGEGTVFRILLPALDARQRPAALPAGDGRPTRGHETILVCEDEEAVRSLACRVLERDGYTVLAADCGNRAVELTRTHRGDIHLLLTDVILPDQSGRKVAEAVRVRFPKIKTLYMSGYAADIIARHGVVDEGVELLDKPFTLVGLRQRVRAILDH
ncbi:MAG: PAS domain-containing protein [Planctomycetota bacterium]